MSGGGYIPDPTDPTRPTVDDLVGNMALEFQTLKGYIQSLIASGTNWYNLDGFRNRLKNPSFSIAQRFLPFTAPAATLKYLIDQWFVLSAGGTTTLNQIYGAYNTNGYSVVLTPNAGCTDLIFGSRIESFDTFDLIQGTQVTVSGSYKDGGTGRIPTVGIFTIGNPAAPNDWSAPRGAVAAEVPISIQSPLLFTNPPGWVYFSNTFTLTQDCTGGIQPYFHWDDPPISANLRFNDIQFEKGNVATPFAKRPVLIDQALCQRYYNFDSGSFIGYASAASQNIFYTPKWVNHMVAFAGKPVLTSFNPSGLVNCSTPTASLTNISWTLISAISLAAGLVSYNYDLSVSCELD